MNDFLNSLKADLSDRRLRPFVILVAVALVGALAYGVLGGSSSSSKSVTAVVAPAPASASITTSEATPKDAVSETTGGAEQHHGVAHNPFDELEPPKPVKAAPAASSATSSTTSSSTTSSAPAKTETTVTTVTKTTTPAKQHTIYHVGVLFGVAPPPPPAAATPLTPYENLKLLTPLPSATSPLIVFRGVTGAGKSATFSIVSEAILHGPGACLPSAAQCQAIDLKAGQSEQLEYLGGEAQVISYELTVASIVAAKASTTSVKKLLGGVSQAGRKVLSSAGLVAIPGLRVSSQPGVLLFAGHSAVIARAHTAQQRAHGH